MFPIVRNNKLYFSKCGIDFKNLKTTKIKIKNIYLSKLQYGVL